MAVMVDAFVGLTVLSIIVWWIVWAASPETEGNLRYLHPDAQPPTERKAMIIPPRGDECFYLTKEQAARIAAITLDSLVGCQIRTDANSESYAILDMVDIDHPSDTRHFVVYPDGSWEETT